VPLEPSPGPAQGLLLDFGAVISFSVFEIIHEVEAALGLPAGGLGWRGPLQPDADPLWQMMQRDEITEREYWELRAEECGRKVGRKMSVLDFMIAAYNLPQEQIIRPGLVSAIEAVRRAGKRVGVLTNELELFHGRRWMDGLQVLRQMDFIVDATHTHILKPAPGAYQLAVQAMGQPAQRIVFLDDQQRNVEGACRAGLIGLHFDVSRPERCIRQAMQCLGLE